MNKITTGALALTLLGSMAMAEANSIYVGGGIVYEDIDGLNAGNAFEIHAGKMIANNFGAEVRISKTFNEAEDNGQYQWPNGGVFDSKLTADLTTVAAYGTYTYSPIPQLSIVPKVGLLYLKGKATLTSGNATKSNSDTETGLSYGLGLKYNITSSFAAYADYTRVASDTQHISIGLERRF